MATSLERIHLRTKHFIAVVDVQNRTWELNGNFPREVRTIADNPWDGDLLRAENRELEDLERMIRSMMEVKAPATEANDGVRMHPVSEG